MKYEDLDSYIENLFQQPEASQDDGLSGYDDRLANVEQAILDAYESAMRWHSAQIAPGDDTTEAQQTSSSWDTNAALGYEYWNEETCPPPRRLSFTRPKAFPPAAPALDDELLWESEPGGLTCGEALVIVAAVLFVFIFVVIAS